MIAKSNLFNQSLASLLLSQTIIAILLLFPFRKGKAIEQFGIISIKCSFWTFSDMFDKIRDCKTVDFWTGNCGDTLLLLWGDNKRRL